MGQRVSTADLEDVGTIKRWDPVTGWMLVERGVPPNKHVTMLPVTIVDGVNPDSGDVFLAVSQADLKRMQHLEPADVVFAEARVNEAS